MTKNIKIELLAPAGNLDKMKTALAFGADAVYVGIPDFSLRVRINDFDLAKIKEAAEYCHALGKKIYVTANIFAHNQHLEKLPGYIKELKEIKVDALIVSDPGVLAIVKEEWPEAILHLSTQANCTNWRAAAFWFAQGVQRVILGRETTLEEIKEIHARLPELELECFVHGAMCMAYSGRCFLSKYYTGRSANLGDCVQPCRWPYSIKSEKLIVESAEIAAVGHSDGAFEVVEEEHGSYILNSKDLCLLKHLRALTEAGICSFKIEGRAKSAYYQAMVAGIYSLAANSGQQATDKELDFYFNELNMKLVHRGYTEGFLFGEKADQNLDDSHLKCEWEFCGQVFAVDTLRPDLPQEAGPLTLLKVHNSIKVGDEIEIVRPKYDIIKLRVDKLWDAKTGAEITEAHGGQGKAVFLAATQEVPEYSVVRRRILKTLE